MPVPDYQTLMLPVLRVLSDGEELARLMVVHDIGIRTRVCHQVKRIDEDYFTQDAL